MIYVEFMKSKELVHCDTEKIEMKSKDVNLEVEIYVLKIDSATWDAHFEAMNKDSRRTC